MLPPANVKQWDSNLETSAAKVFCRTPDKTSKSKFDRAKIPPKIVETSLKLVLGQNYNNFIIIIIIL